MIRDSYESYSIVVRNMNCIDFEVVNICYLLKDDCIIHNRLGSYHIFSHSLSIFIELYTLYSINFIV